MGKVDRLRSRVKPFAALSWGLGIVLANTWPCPPAQHHSTAVHKASSYMVIVGSIFDIDALPPPLFSYLGLLFIYLWYEYTIHNISFGINSQFLDSNKRYRNYRAQLPYRRRITYFLFHCKSTWRNPGKSMLAESLQK